MAKLEQPEAEALLDRCNGDIVQAVATFIHFVGLLEGLPLYNLPPDAQRDLGITEPPPLTDLFATNASAAAAEGCSPHAAPGAAAAAAPPAAANAPAPTDEVGNVVLRKRDAALKLVRGVLYHAGFVGGKRARSLDAQAAPTGEQLAPPVELRHQHSDDMQELQAQWRRRQELMHQYQHSQTAPRQTLLAYKYLGQTAGPQVLPRAAAPQPARLGGARSSLTPWASFPAGYQAASAAGSSLAGAQAARAGGGFARPSLTAALQQQAPSVVGAPQGLAPLRTPGHPW